jgi:hypothetical protein
MQSDGKALIHDGKTAAMRPEPKEPYEEMNTEQVH